MYICSELITWQGWFSQDELPDNLPCWPDPCEGGGGGTADLWLTDWTGGAAGHITGGVWNQSDSGSPYQGQWLDSWLQSYLVPDTECVQNLYIYSEFPTESLFSS